MGRAVTPSAGQLLSGVVLVREAGDCGILGRYIAEEDVVVEIGLNWHPDIKKLGETPIVSMIVWRGRKTLFEFFAGFTVKMPARSDAAAFVLPVVNALTHWSPQVVSRSMLRI